MARCAASFSSAVAFLRRRPRNAWVLLFILHTHTSRHPRAQPLLSRASPSRSRCASTRRQVPMARAASAVPPSVKAVPVSAAGVRVASTRLRAAVSAPCSTRSPASCVRHVGGGVRDLLICTPLAFFCAVALTILQYPDKFKSSQILAARR